jgi:hypothetical protein
MENTMHGVVEQPARIRNVQEALYGCVLSHSGLDYLTATCSDAQGQAKMKLFWARSQPQLERLGFKQKKGGFQGYVGLSCGPLFLGQRHDGMAIRASGPLASELFEAADWQTWHPTRIDTQVTVRLPEYADDLAQLIADERAAQAKKSGIKLTPKQLLHRGYGEGDTLDIGSRHSPRFGRVYDKQKQSDDAVYAQCWRFEVEFKKLMAPKVVEALGAAEDPGQTIIDIVAGQFADWGVYLPLSDSPLCIPGSIGRREPDTDRSMVWLAAQVAPTVERLLGQVAVTEILAALRLNEESPQVLEFARTVVALADYYDRAPGDRF